MFIFSTGTVNYGQCNPHGIDTILSRRTAAQAALNTLTSSNSNSSPPNSTSNGSSTTSGNNTAPSVNPYFKLEDLHQAAAAAAQIANQRQNSNLYWPGIQGLISNPHIWRERFNGKPLLKYRVAHKILNHLTLKEAFIKRHLKRSKWINQTQF